MSSPEAMQSPLNGELRHVTSSNGLTTTSKDSIRHSTRGAPHLQTGSMRLGSRSPTSIPSSPTSVHSSSSAIFERDIEPICPPSPPNPNHPVNPHRIPRGKGTEQLELSVPSVLDSAAEILTSPTTPGEDDAAAHIAVLTPVIATRSGLGSPVGSLSRSRSPSPTLSGRASMANSLLFSGGPANQYEGTTSPIRPTIQTAMEASTSTGPAGAAAAAKPSPSDLPAIVTPSSMYYSVASSSAGSSPKTTTAEHAPTFPPPRSPSLKNGTGGLSPSSNPPSPLHAATKRLSFMSYGDLLTSTPSSTLPLSSLTTSASSNDPPPHIPSVMGLVPHASSPGGSIHGGNRDSLAMLDDVGGEWNREGLGMGLEERLEALMGDEKPGL